MNLTTVLTAVRNLGGRMPPVRLVGRHPEFVGERMGLSPTVVSAVPRAVALIEGDHH
jgi:hypothetical protein